MKQAWIGSRRAAVFASGALLASGAVLVFGACSKGSPGDSPASSASVTTAESAATPSSASASPVGKPSGSAANQTGTASWKGTYKSTPGTIVLPKDVKWKIPETTAGVGDGTLALAVDRSTGRVQGTIDGVLGPAKVDGVLVDGKIAATIVRQDPGDHGFTGTLSGDMTGTAAQGSMNLALADVSAVRNATFDAAPVP